MGWELHSSTNIADGTNDLKEKSKHLFNLRIDIFLAYDLWIRGNDAGLGEECVDSLFGIGIGRGWAKLRVGIKKINAFVYMYHYLMYLLIMN